MLLPEPALHELLVLTRLLAEEEPRAGALVLHEVEQVAGARADHPDTIAPVGAAHRARRLCLPTPIANSTPLRRARCCHRSPPRPRSAARPPVKSGILRPADHPLLLFGSN